MSLVLMERANMNGIGILFIEFNHKTIEDCFVIYVLAGLQWYLLRKD